MAHSYYEWTFYYQCIVSVIWLMSISLFKEQFYSLILGGTQAWTRICIDCFMYCSRLVGFEYMHSLFYVFIKLEGSWKRLYRWVYSHCCWVDRYSLNSLMDRPALCRIDWFWKRRQPRWIMNTWLVASNTVGIEHVFALDEGCGWLADSEYCLQWTTWGYAVTERHLLGASCW